MSNAGSVIDAFMAKLEADSHAALAKRERERTDKRLNDLLDYVAVFSLPAPRDGMAGAADVFSGLMSARHWRNLRAKSLVMVRKQQLHSDPRSARFWLRKAAEQRVTEREYRRAERRVEMAPLLSAATSGYLRVAAE